ncbi:MAG: NTP transferase domain-containing protein [Bacillota bacterium]
MIPAVVLAGAPNTGRLREVSPVPWEALIDIHGRPMAAYVIDALLAAPAVGKVAVVGPPELEEACVSGRLLFLAPRGSMLENLTAGLDAFPDAPRVLIATADIPLLTPASAAGFLDLCAGGGAEVYYPVIPRAVVEKALPGVRRTYVRLRDGVFTGGNLGLVDPRAIRRCLGRAREFVRLRKKPLRLALVVGPGFLGRFLLGRLTLREAERRVSELLGFRGRAVIAPFPEIGVDVDKPADLEAVKKVMREIK